MGAKSAANGPDKVARAPTLIVLFVIPGAVPAEDEEVELLDAFEHDARTSVATTTTPNVLQVRAVRRVNVPPENRSSLHLESIRNPHFSSGSDLRSLPN